MELIQRNKQKSEALGSGLRHGSFKSLRRRRGIFGLFLAASASMSVIALYQLGILRRVPEPPLRRFDSDNITGSAKAYSLLATPDAVLAMGSYALTMTLAAMGSRQGERTTVASHSAGGEGGNRCRCGGPIYP